MPPSLQRLNKQSGLSSSSFVRAGNQFSHGCLLENTAHYAPNDIPAMTVEATMRSVFQCEVLWRPQRETFFKRWSGGTGSNCRRNSFTTRVVLSLSCSDLNLNVYIYDLTRLSSCSFYQLVSSIILHIFYGTSTDWGTCWQGGDASTGEVSPSVKCLVMW